MLRLRTKICCIASLEEMQLAVRHGASAVGLVSEMPSGPGVIGEERIAEIAQRVPPGVTAVLLTSRTRAEEIVAQQRRCRTGAIQLCDLLEPRDYAQLRSSLPGIGLVQVIHVDGAIAVEEALEAARHVDALLLDSGSRRLPIKELGGTGRTHDWSLSRAIRERVQVPVWLAGGLHAENVAAAIDTVKPFGVDVCSGVRLNGKLCEPKLEAFTRAIG